MYHNYISEGQECKLISYINDGEDCDSDALEDNTYKQLKKRHCEKGSRKKQLHYSNGRMRTKTPVRLAPAKVCDLHFAGDSDSDRSFITPIKLFHLLLSCVRKSFRLCCCWSCDSMRCCFRRCLCPIRCVARFDSLYIVPRWRPSLVIATLGVLHVLLVHYFCQMY